MRVVRSFQNVLFRKLFRRRGVDVGQKEAGVLNALNLAEMAEEARGTKRPEGTKPIRTDRHHYRRLGGVVRYVKWRR